MKAKRTILVGWDAADWKIIDSLIAKGQMPTMEFMVKNGVRGNLSTLEPVLSPMLWSSIATGKYADKHGIHGFTEPDYEQGFVKPISSTSRKAKAIWNILTHQGYKSNVFAWWPSNPAEPINGVMVSNLYQRAGQSIDKPWPMPAGTVHPEKLSKHFADLRVHPDELTEAHILPFIPDAAKVDQEKDHKIGALSKIIADAATVHAASTWAIEETDWDFTAVYHDAIDHACHAFMKFRAPQLPGLPDDQFQIYQHVVDGMYRFHDMMLERILNMVGPDTNVIVISDHGFQSDHLRPLRLPKEPAGPAAEHRKHGIVCMFGPDFKKGEEIYGSSILDIAPTLLTLYGLPIGSDMDGTPLVQAFAETPKVKRIESWENVTGGDFGTHPEDLKTDRETSKTSVQQLVDLGYIEDPGKDREKAIRNTEIELQYNLSRVYISTGRSEMAIPLLLDIIKDKEENRFLMRLADCYKRTGKFTESQEMLERVKKLEDVSEHAVRLFEAELFTAQEKHEDALRILIELKEKAKLHTTLLMATGNCYLRLNNYKSALPEFEMALKIDPHNTTAWHGKGLCLLRMKKHEKAIESLLTAIELTYQFPSAHLALGEALYEVGEYNLAAKSLEVALSMRPGLNKAERLLDQIVQNHGIDRQQLFSDFISQEETTAAYNRDSMVKAISKKGAEKSYTGRKLGEITIVSGLPRSGTSMMMQMLKNGGMEIFTDDVREADANNPKGFFEHEKIKALAKNNKFLKDAKGKAAKVVCQLVKFLPANYNYKVILMKRDLQEVVTSQHKMLVEMGKAKPDTYPAKLERNFDMAYKSAKAWALNKAYVEVIEIEYAEVVARPLETAAKIKAFLGKEFDAEAMASAVDSKLYRNRLKDKAEA